MSSKGLILIRTVIAAALLSAFAVAPAGPALAQAKTPLRVAYTPAVPWLTAWVAMDAGLFERNGLDVKFLVVQNLSLLPPTLGKQIDIAATTPPDVIKAVASGLDVVGITGGTLELPTNRVVELIVGKDSNIKTAKDLEGKLIATPTLGAVMHIATMYWLKKNGVNPNSIRAVEVPFPNMADQLKAGRVDAAEVIQPFAGALLGGDGVSITDPIMAIGDSTMITLWIADGAWARTNQATVAKWNTSIREAIEFIKTKPAETRSILAKYTKLPDPVVQRLPIPEYDATLTPTHLDVWIKVLKDLGQVTGNLDSVKMVIGTN
jgi:NitT/TauT family transport system substrate-binding protein